MDLPQNVSPPAEILYRLVELTQAGELAWTYMYPSNPNVETEAELPGLTEPVAYLLEDNRYGFGRGLIKVHDVEMETQAPGVYLQGNRLDVSDGLSAMLLDAVRLHVEEVQRGTAPPPGHNTQQMIVDGIGAVRGEVSDLTSALETLLMQNAQQGETMRNLSMIALHHTQAPPPDQVLLTPQTLKECLRVLVGDTYDFDFDAHYDEDACRKAVQTVTFRRQHGAGPTVQNVASLDDLQKILTQKLR
jgi:hypothetical protein